MMLPDWLDLRAWHDWIEDRKERRIKTTSRSMTISINVLSKQKHLQREIIDNSIEKGYRGLFNLREADLMESPKNNQDWERYGQENKIIPKVGETMPNYKVRVKAEMDKRH